MSSVPSSAAALAARDSEITKRAYGEMAIAALGMIFAAMYLLIMVGRIVFGPEKLPPGTPDEELLPQDLSVREITVLVPLAVFCIVLGVQPWIVIDGTSAAVADTLAVYEPILGQAKSAVQGSLVGGAP